MTDGDCQISLATPYDQDVRLEYDPDQVNINFDIEWWDERTGTPAEIIHRFQISTTYGSTPYGDYVEKRTSGGMGSPGTDSFYVQVDDVASSTSIYVYYTVTVRYASSGSVLCSLDNSWQVPPNEEPSFNFV